MVRDTFVTAGTNLFELEGIDPSTLSKLVPLNRVSKKEDLSPEKVKPFINDYLNTLGVAPWGTDNLYPQQAVKDLKCNALAMRAMKFRIDAHYGAGMLLYRTFVNEQFKITIQPVQDNQDYKDFANANSLVKLQAGLISDWEWFRMAFYEIILSNDGKKINRINRQPAMFCRFAQMDENHNINTCYLSSRWGFFTAESDVIKLPVLDLENPLQDLKKYIANGGKERKFIVCDQLNELDYVYYSFPYWDPIRYTWLAVAQKIPALKLAMITHQMVLKFHIKIPYSYWQNKYTDWNNKSVFTPARQEETIAEKLKEFNDFLTDTKNYGKSIITHYGVDPVSLKNFEEWKIEPLDNTKLKDGAHISDSQSANSEIVTSIGVDPALLGGQLPGGSEAGSGSNKREAFSIHQAQIGLDRDMTTKWFQLIRDYNGWDSSLNLGFKDVDTSQTLNENPNGKQTIAQV